MDKQLLKSHMVKKGDTQAILSAAMGISLSRLNAKINSTAGADFNQTEIAFIANRYKLSATEIKNIFFSSNVSLLDTSRVSSA